MKEFTVGNKKYLVLQPTFQQIREGKKKYNMAFRDALESGAYLRAKVYDIAKSQGLWDEEKQEEYNKLLADIKHNTKIVEHKNVSKSYSIDEAEKAAKELITLRIRERILSSSVDSLDSHTAESQAENEEFNFLLSQCLVYDNKEKVFSSYDEYLNAPNDEVMRNAHLLFTELQYGVSADFENDLPEIKFLKEFNFVDEQGRYVKDGKFVNLNGDEVDSEGYLIKDGKRVDEDGDPVRDTRLPFRDQISEDVNKTEEEQQD